MAPDEPAVNTCSHSSSHGVRWWPGRGTGDLVIQMPSRYVIETCHGDGDRQLEKILERVKRGFDG